MKNKKAKLWVVLLALGSMLVYAMLGNAGSLEPSSPPGPTMKTLNEVEPRIPIHAADLPLTITEPNSYYFAEDISFEPNDVHAITIECNDVTIDLMGYTLKGPDSGSTSGVYVEGRSNVEVRNGTIRNFGWPAILEYSTSGIGHRVINVRVSSCYFGIFLSGNGHLVKDCTASETTNTGIYINGGGGTATGNTCYSNEEEGIYILSGSIVTGNTCYNNGDNGIDAHRGCTVNGNSCYSNGGDGINSNDGSTVTGNTARYNEGNGIVVYDDCMVTDNTCSENGYQDGDGAGIHAIGIYNHIERNNVTSNDRGIDVDDVNNLIVKNSAGGNTTEYDIVGGNKVGTISTDPTTAGPWDNFDL